MVRKKKSWREKLEDSKDLPKVVKIPQKSASRWGAKAGDTLVIPAPVEVDEMMRKVPRGKLITINGIREALARKHGTALACPICTGIFASIAARAAKESRSEGSKDITPYWRTLKSGGELNSKYPGGVEGQKTLLEREGHRVLVKGKKYLVADFEKNLVRL